MYDYVYNITGVTHGHNNKRIQGYQGVYKCNQGCILLGSELVFDQGGEKIMNLYSRVSAQSMKLPTTALRVPEIYQRVNIHIPNKLMRLDG